MKKPMSAPAKLLIHLFYVSILLLAIPVQADNVELVHIHGMSFDTHGKRLLIPSHFGIAVYQAGHWKKLAGPEHDYMGFTVTDNALYTSGHPAVGSKLPNPFGLKKSHSNTMTWKTLGMEGEADFHVMAAGYHNNAIYVLNMIPNRTLPLRGIYYTLNDGNMWNYAQARFAPEPVSLAVHPRRSGIVAIGSREGLFLSRDHAQNFKSLDSSREIFAVCFEFDNRHLLYAGYDIGPSLIRLEIETGKRTTIHIPALENDAVGYIAQNPVDQKQLAIATFNRDVYLTSDSGQSWRKIADLGRVMETVDQ